MLRILLIRLRNNPLCLQIEKDESEGKGVGDAVSVIQEEQTPANDSAGIDENIVD